MATYNWTGATSGVLTTTTNWTGSPTIPFPTGDVANFTSGATRAPGSGGTGGIAFPSMRLESTYNLGNIDLTPTSAISFTGYNNTNALDGTTCSVFIGAGKIFDANQPAAGTNYVYSSATNPGLKIYVDTGGEFRVRLYGGSQANSYIEKLGPGTLYFNYGGTATTAPTASKGVQLSGGTVAVRGPDYLTGNPILGATAVMQFNSGAAIFQVGASGGSRTFAYDLKFSSGATFDIGTGTTMVFSAAPSSTGGTLTIAGTGTLQFTSASFTVLSSSINFTANGTLSVPSGLTINGSTLSSTGAGITGTIATAGSYTVTISNNAPTFVGDVTGDFAYSGTNKTFGGRVTGNVKVAANSSVTFSRTGTHTGFLAEVLPNATGVVQGNFTSAGDGYTDVYYTGTLQFDGPTAQITTAQVSAWDQSTVKLTGATNCTGGLNMTFDNSGLNKGATTVVSDDLNTNVWSGSWVCGGDAATRSSIQVRAKTDGVLEFSGTATSNGASHTRPFNLNGAAGYAGTIRLTGGGFNTANAPVNLLSGKLHLNRAGTISIGGSTGLTVSNGATVGCSSTGAYAAQLSGAMVLQNNSTLKFGAAP